MFGGTGGFRSRIQALLSIDQADLLADFRLSQLIETRKMLGCSSVISGKLIGACQTEFSGQMKRTERQAFFESCDGLIVTAGLHVKLTEKVQRVCVARIEAGNLFEGLDGRRGLGKRPVRNPKVVPGARATRLAPCRIEKNVARFGKLLAVQQSDPFI